MLFRIRDGSIADTFFGAEMGVIARQISPTDFAATPLCYWAFFLVVTVHIMVALLRQFFYCVTVLFSSLVSGKESPPSSLRIFSFFTLFVRSHQDNLTIKVRSCEQSEPRSEPFVGQARYLSHEPGS